MEAVSTSVEIGSEKPRSRVSDGSRPQLTAADVMLMEKVQTGYTYPETPAEKDATVEETILEKLDSFLELLETRMNTFENYFKSNGDSTAKTEVRDESMASLEDFYETLNSVKRSIIGPASLRIEALSKVLDDHYGSLFPSQASSSLNVKILMGLNFLDAKISQLDSLMNNENHKINLVNNEIAAIQSRRDPQSVNYNLENCIRWAQTRYLNYYELPLPWRENKYIVDGYRFNDTKTSACKSMVCLHNETINIWTHLVGFGIMLWVSVWHFPSTAVFQTNSLWDNLVFYNFLVAAMICLVSSVFWHTFASASQLTFRSNCACVDYTGITILITASIITTEHAALYYFPIIRTIFMTFSVLCGVFGLVFNWTPYFDKPESRPLRIGFYVSLAGLGVCAAICLMFYRGVVHSLIYYAPLVKSFAMYLLGVVFYGCLIPERWRSDYTIFTEAALKRQEENDVCEEMEYLNELETLVIPVESYSDPTEVFALSEHDVDKFFNKKLIKMPHAHSFRSLWWVDYYLSSHNLWHLFVLFGILGHYGGALEMFGNIRSNA